MPRRVANPTECRSCGAPILCGLDDDQAAMDAFVDPIPVTLDGEVTACLQGRLTYDVYPIDTSGGVELRRRLLYNLPMRTTDVLVEHRCHSEPLPTVLRGPEPISVTPSGDPPF